MLDTLCRAMFVLSMTALSVSLGWASAPAPAGKKAVRNSAAIQAQMEQVEKDLVAAEKAEKEYELQVNRYFRSLGCGNDIMDRIRDLEKAREHLQTLEANKGDTTKVEAAKAEVAKYERYLRETLNYKPTVPEPAGLEKAPEVMNNLRRKVADLRTLRDELKEELRDRQASLKKAS